MWFLTNKAISVALEVGWDELGGGFETLELPVPASCGCILPPASKGADGTSENRDPIWRE